MKIIQNAVVGTIESSDIMITLKPNNSDKIAINLDSSVEKQFGEHIKETILDTLKKLDVTAADVKAFDKGALDCTIIARTITAVYRAAGQDELDWKVIDSWNA